MRRIVLMLLIVAVASPLLAQSQQEAYEYNRAKLMMRRGATVEAIKIFERLHENNPTNVVFFNELKSAYTETGQFEKLLLVLEAQLEKRPGDWRISAEMGNALFKLERPEDAKAQLESLLAANKNSVTVHRIVANIYYQNRRYSEVEKLYTYAQLTAENPAPFIRELAQHFTIRLNYGAATREFVSYLLSDKNDYGYVKQQISRFMSDSSTYELVIGELRVGSIENPESLELKRLLGDYLFRVGHFSDALGVYRSLESSTGGKGELLFGFATALKREKKYALAKAALVDVLTGNLDSRIYPKAFYELAETQELLEAEDLEKLYSEPIVLHPLSSTGINESPETPESVVLYDSLAAMYPRTPMAARSYLRIGEIQLQRMQNLDLAQSYLDRALRIRSSGEIVDRARFLSARVRLEKGDLIGAMERFEGLAKTTRYDRTRFDCLLAFARMEFFIGEFDSSIYHINEFIFEVDMKDRLMNDALELSLLMETNRVKNDDRAEEALRAYARAEALAERRHHSEAEAAFAMVASEYAKSPIADEAAFRQAEMRAIMGLYDDALEGFEAFIENRSGSDLIEKSILAIAEIYEIGLGDIDSAAEFYERLLEEYPGSLFADKVRERLRRIQREESIN